MIKKDKEKFTFKKTIKGSSTIELYLIIHYETESYKIKNFAKTGFLKCNYINKKANIIAIKTFYDLINEMLEFANTKIEQYKKEMEEN